MSLELKGIRGFACYQAYLSTIYFLPLTKTYRESEMSRFEMQHDFTESPIGRKKEILVEVLSVTTISERDVVRFISVHKDPNGIDYSEVNASNLSIDKMVDLVFESLLACSNASKTLFFYPTPSLTASKNTP
ncbi:hypothetical protein [Photobacterium indicum]|uniref:Uncharacterized protein n=1 Tax=Photobacterium indicum TaxID=81447 RepID=A0A2T3LF94_9GAMM|nr:hypothetical protein [Photobacterium indicum]PSV50036.1 hypothetical protein C9J47_05660 [Photobacterium indicum]